MATMLLQLVQEEAEEELESPLRNRTLQLEEAAEAYKVSPFLMPLAARRRQEEQV